MYMPPFLENFQSREIYRFFDGEASLGSLPRVSFLRAARRKRGMRAMASEVTSNRMMSIDDPREARRIIRAGEYTGHTAAIAPEFLQGNLCILPQAFAIEFAAFCQRNPKPCPIVGM